MVLTGLDQKFQVHYVRDRDEAKSNLRSSPRRDRDLQKAVLRPRPISSSTTLSILMDLLQETNDKLSQTKCVLRWTVRRRPGSPASICCIGLSRVSCHLSAICNKRHRMPEKYCLVMKWRERQFAFTSLLCSVRISFVNFTSQRSDLHQFSTRALWMWYVYETKHYCLMFETQICRSFLDTRMFACTDTLLLCVSMSVPVCLCVYSNWVSKEKDRTVAFSNSLFLTWADSRCRCSE